MNDLASLAQAVATIVLVVAPIIALARLIGADDVGVTLSDVFAVSVNPPWPHRLQEEEPVRWRVELLRPRHRTAGAWTARPVERPAERPAGRMAGRPAPAAAGSDPGCGS